MVARASPYAALEKGPSDYVNDGVAHGDESDVVTAGILSAANDPEAPLRVTVGTEAAGLIAARHATLDIDWLAGVRAMYGLASLPAPS